MCRNTYTIKNYIGYNGWHNDGNTDGVFSVTLQITTFLYITFKPYIHKNSITYNITEKKIIYKLIPRTKKYPISLYDLGEMR